MAPDRPRPAPGALRVEGLVVDLGGRRVLDGLALSVEAGTTTAVLGPSGCGKTTLLRVIAGLVEPSGGTVRLDGADLAGVPSHRRGLAMMFQQGALFPHRDVAGNVGFGLRMQGVGSTARARRVGEVLELVGLAGYQGRRVDGLSGGEAQRVALARALAPRPRALLLDEPLASLDRVLRDRLLGDLRRVFAELELTVIHVTHDREEALAIADRLAVVGDGRVRQEGTPQGLWEAPASTEVARFLGLDSIWPVEVVGGEARCAGRAVVAGLAAADGPAELVVRPTAVAIEGRPVAGRLALRVSAVTFAGDRTLVDLAAGWDPSLPALRAVVVGHAPAVGEEVAVGIGPGGCSVLPATGPPAEAPD